VRGSKIGKKDERKYAKIAKVGPDISFSYPTATTVKLFIFSNQILKADFGGSCDCYYFT